MPRMPSERSILPCTFAQIANSTAAIARGPMIPSSGHGRARRGTAATKSWGRSVRVRGDGAQRDDGKRSTMRVDRFVPGERLTRPTSSAEEHEGALEEREAR